MTPFEHPNCTHLLGKPKQWDDTTECQPLPVCKTTDANGLPLIASFWKPDAEELARLNAGGCVQLAIYGQGMPPVWVAVL